MFRNLLCLTKLQNNPLLHTWSQPLVFYELKTLLVRNVRWQIWQRKFNRVANIKMILPYNNRDSQVLIWAASSEFGTYSLCEQRRFRRACASAQSRQNLRCSLIQAVSQEEPSDRKPDPWPLWMAGHAQLKFVITECSKTQIRLAGLNWWFCFPRKCCNCVEKLWLSDIFKSATHYHQNFKCAMLQGCTVSLL